MNFCIEGDVRGRHAVDREFLAGAFGELKESADVIVLVVTAEQAFRFSLRQTERSEANRLAKFAGLCKVKTDQIAQRHHGSAASGLRARGVLLSRVYFGSQKVGTKLTQQPQNENRLMDNGENLNSPIRGDWHLVRNARIG